jgi:hypothetical protein
MTQTPKVSVVIPLRPAWFDSVESALHDLGCAVLNYQDRANYVARLADDNAALILVSGDDTDWQFWVTTAKISPATRRIPVIVVSDHPTRRADSLRAGANMALSANELLPSLEGLISEVARIPDANSQAELEYQCVDPLPTEAQEAVARFNDGEYYKQHDLFEALWMNDPRPVRDLYRAVLQVGIAYYQITRGNWRGAHKMLLRSIQWLALLPDICQGIDIAALRADAAAVRAELDRVGENGIAQFDRSLLKPVKYSPTTDA